MNWRVIAILFLAWAAPVFGGSSYHVLFFSYQDRNGNVPRESHTFATFAQVTAKKGAFDVESVTISWLPAAGKVRALRRKPEPGVNTTLLTAVTEATRQNLRLSAWGPYAIPMEVYARAVLQEARLRSGAILYKTVDKKFRPKALNCMHAVSDLIGFLDTGNLRGAPGTQAVVDFYKSKRLLSSRHPSPVDLFSALDIENFKFQRRP